MSAIFLYQEELFLLPDLFIYSFSCSHRIDLGLLILVNEFYSIIIIFYCEPLISPNLAGESPFGLAPKPF